MSASPVLQGLGLPTLLKGIWAIGGVSDLLSHYLNRTVGSETPRTTDTRANNMALGSLPYVTGYLVYLPSEDRGGVGRGRVVRRS